MASIIGEIVGEGAAGLVNAVGDQINKKSVIEADLAKTEILADTQVAVAQNQVNQAQASSDDKYTSRARPTLFYACTAGFAYQYVLQPFLLLIAKFYHIDIITPVLDMTPLCTLLIPMSGLRSLDKGSFDGIFKKK